MSRRRAVRRAVVFVCLLAGLGALSPMAAAQTPRGSEETAPRARIAAYYRSLSARDWQELPEHFWPGGIIATVWAPPGGEGAEVMVQTAGEFARRGPEGPGSREIFEERPLTVEVEVRDGLAVAWVRYRARFGDPGAVVEWEGTDAFTLIEKGGVWRISSLAFAGEAGEGPGEGGGPEG